MVINEDKFIEAINNELESRELFQSNNSTPCYIENNTTIVGVIGRDSSLDTDEFLEIQIQFDISDVVDSSENTQDAVSEVLSRIRRYVIEKIDDNDFLFSKIALSCGLDASEFELAESIYNNTKSMFESANALEESLEGMEL